MKISTCLLSLALLGAAGFAQAQNCTVKLEGNDSMQFDQKEVTVNASCANITLELHHTGKLPAAAMGHNIVIVATADANAVAADGLRAGLTDKATFPGNKLKAGGDYTFLCTFPGHSAIMRGKLVVQ